MFSMSVAVDEAEEAIRMFSSGAVDMDIVTSPPASTSALSSPSWPTSHHHNYHHHHHHVSRDIDGDLDLKATSSSLRSPSAHPRSHHCNTTTTSMQVTFTRPSSASSSFSSSVAFSSSPSSSSCIGAGTTTTTTMCTYSRAAPQQHATMMPNTDLPSVARAPSLLMAPPPSPPFFNAPIEMPPAKSPLNARKIYWADDRLSHLHHRPTLTFDDIPPEVLTIILEHLNNGRDLLRSGRVCHLWNALSHDPALWRPICLQHPDVSMLMATILKAKSYRQSWLWYMEATTRKFVKGIHMKKEGLGCFEFDNGEHYHGEWSSDKFHGIGVCTWPDGRKYQGEFRDGKRGGYGIFTWTNGCRYEGEWDMDKRHGKGKDVWPDTSSYVGEYKHDKFDGFGVFVWDDGGVYEGQWREDQRHGWGRHTWKDGRVYEGEYKLDKFQGERF
eukprot:TRINITY_DN1003_c0_g1_i1.p1 TRINITY_DN1003_c0_g1~~TRINITY_DN1003_c0_g1_i1.p1  ORF type:complete len:441 (-),score=155.83 TRINITY_DN1003_c0_g1_i1:425-1747(-)